MNLAMIVSGGGTTMRAILSSCIDGVLSRLVSPKLVIATRGNIGAIGRAIRAGIGENDIICLDPTYFDSRHAWGEEVIVQCDLRGIDFVGLYGCLTRIPENVIEHFGGRMVNQHPSPPQFGGPGMWGKRPHAAVLKYYELQCAFSEQRYSWVIAQQVDVEYDRGAVFRSELVKILPSDKSNDPGPLQQRAIPFEHFCQIGTLEDFVRGHAYSEGFNYFFDDELCARACAWAIENIEP